MSCVPGHKREDTAIIATDVYGMTQRTWEQRSVLPICVFPCLCIAIRVTTVGIIVRNIVWCTAINDEWLVV